MTYLRFSLAVQLLLAVYFQTINWLHLGAWNNQPGFVPLITSVLAGPVDWESIGVSAFFVLPALLYVLAFRNRWRWLMWAGTLGYACWLYFQLQTWWVPYLFGASEHWQEVYHRVFAHTTQILPSSGNHPAPDAMHLVIQILLVCIVVTSFTGLAQTRHKKPSGT